MFVFAHLRKCAGTAVVRAADRAGLRLPAGHVNGHPAGVPGHALGGLAKMTRAELDGLVRPMAEAGVEFVAIEWDFPRFEQFPEDLGLRFFTILRDPVERLWSNFTYDIANNYVSRRNIYQYLDHGVIWRSANYFTRFFAGLQSSDEVEESDVNYAYEILTTRFQYAFVGDNLLKFLSRDVGLPISNIKQENKTSRLARMRLRRDFGVSSVDTDYLRLINALDYQLFDKLKARLNSRAGERWREEL